MTAQAPPDPKATLHRYLRRQRENLSAKLDGLGERDLRWPMTVTGTLPGSCRGGRAERRQVTLHQILVHMAVEAARHAGHADIIRELIDGSSGNNDGNLPEQTAADWAAYRARLERAAEEAASHQP